MICLLSEKYRMKFKYFYIKFVEDIDLIALKINFNKLIIAKYIFLNEKSIFAFIIINLEDYPKIIFIIL
jgi:hypothetical protein